MSRYDEQVAVYEAWLKQQELQRLINIIKNWNK